MIKEVSLIFVFLAFLVLSITLNKNLIHNKQFIPKQDRAFNIKDKSLSIGLNSYKRLIADIYWITTLLESDIEKYNEKNLNNWMFLRFKTIATLDPLFLSNYLFGGQYLSIIKNDLEGADWILKKGLSIFKDNYDLNFIGGYFYVFEKADYSIAYDLFDRIKSNPKAPKFIASLLAKIKLQETNDPETAFSVLLEVYETTSDPFLKNKLDKDLYALKATIDLRCLNAKKKNCNIYDFKGLRYLNNNGDYYTQLPFSEFKLNK